MVMAALLASCDSLPGVSEGDERDFYRDRTVESLYNNAMDNVESGWYTTAAALFDEVERQHPYSTWATKAQLMAAYSQYLRDSYDEAIIALDRFIELHPGHPDVAYAQYLKALSYYEQISDVGRDQKMTQLALATLRNVVKRYPDTTYARDARIKLDLTQDHLAGKEMEIGRYYMRRKEYLAAINRFKTVIENFQTTTHVPEALHRMTESYLALGISDEAQMTTAVLGHNYPGSRWYEDSYALLDRASLQPELKRSSWLSWMWDWAF
ncbi:MAG: outer membrane protein assembly factor BamD [Alphaproteobacteria bacterium]|nr:outer membrane protein assembly factor BamD [Alphaproteobacteria bacterium]